MKTFNVDDDDDDDSDDDDVCLCMTKPTHIVGRRCFCSVKTRRITNAAEEWKRKRHQIDAYTVLAWPTWWSSQLFFLSLHFFPFASFLVIVVFFVCASFYLFKWTQTCELVFFRLPFIVFVSTVIAVVVVFFFFELRAIFRCANEYILHDRVHQ